MNILNKDVCKFCKHQQFLLLIAEFLDVILN